MSLKTVVVRARSYTGLAISRTTKNHVEYDVKNVKSRKEMYFVHFRWE